MGPRAVSFLIAEPEPLWKVPLAALLLEKGEKMVRRAAGPVKLEQVSEQAGV